MAAKLPICSKVLYEKKEAAIIANDRVSPPT